MNDIIGSKKYPATEVTGRNKKNKRPIDLPDEWGGPDIGSNKPFHKNYTGPSTPKADSEDIAKLYRKDKMTDVTGAVKNQEPIVRKKPKAQTGVPKTKPKTKPKAHPMDRSHVRKKYDERMNLKKPKPRLWGGRKKRPGDPSYKAMTDVTGAVKNQEPIARKKLPAKGSSGSSPDRASPPMAKRRNQTCKFF